jgi:hypothetical protein
VSGFWTWSLVVIVPLLLAAMIAAHEAGLGIRARSGC